MELVLTRTKLDSNSTEGELCLYGDGHQLCYTLELPVKDGLPGSAIPPGLYQIRLLPSPKFQLSTDPWVMQYAATIPHVLGIPNRSEIEIHWGNDAADTEGCILVGQTQGVDFIGGSREAFAALYPSLLAAQQAGEAITLQVNGGIPLQNG
jgi:hypothetical protein